MIENGTTRARRRELQRAAAANPLARAPREAGQVVGDHIMQIDRQTAWGLTLNK